ncbi:hypothetical protein COW46_02325 [Candidatus Gracilibacteria bacterium CG17_big_fil_post_rev_8_21_14_2_50_48_13]|nr:MAG: hypothetical protein COW46_02325 [Candidatus Gracilibacteria bacterium CG17_big_fil_post_rev_8_21_14_2_50_48_13]
MVDLQRHIGIALLGCSLILFGAWALPYLGEVDGFSASAASQITLAPEHQAMEGLLADLAKARKNHDDPSASEEAIIGVFTGLLETENPNNQLLRGDAAYLLALYASAAGLPCKETSFSSAFCASDGGEGAKTPSLQMLRETVQKDSTTVSFSDIHAQLWYSSYVIMLQGLGAIDPDLDAKSSEIPVFDGASPIYAADFARWLQTLDGLAPMTTTSPNSYITRKDAIELITGRLLALWAARAAR